jgi:hypothetical protein
VHNPTSDTTMYKTLVTRSKNHTLYSQARIIKTAWINAIYTNLGTLARYSPTSTVDAVNPWSRVDRGLRLRTRVNYRRFMKRATSGECIAIARLYGGMSSRAVHMKLHRLLEQLERTPEQPLVLDRGNPGQDKQIRFIDVNWKQRIRIVMSGVGLAALIELEDLIKQLARNFDLNFGRQQLAETLGVSDERIISRWLAQTQVPNLENRNRILLTLSVVASLAIDAGESQALGPLGKTAAQFERLSDSTKTELHHKSLELMVKKRDLSFTVVSAPESRPSQGHHWTLRNRHASSEPARSGTT